MAYFNDDGRADILWRHAVDDSSVIWQMNGLNIELAHSIRTVTDTNWDIISD